MESKVAIGLAVATVALLALFALAVRHVGLAAGKLSAEQGHSTAGIATTTPLEKRELLVPTARYNVSERTDDGINIVPRMAEVTDLLNDSESDPADDLARVGELVRFHTSTFGTIPPGGENVDIMRAMTGVNERKLATIPPDHRVLSETGELLDRWGTPYHFHPVSRQVLEIRSAGPDRSLYTEDDIVEGGDHNIVVDRPPGLLQEEEES